MIKSNEKQFIRFENKILFDDLLQSRVALLKSTHVSLKKKNPNNLMLFCFKFENSMSKGQIFVKAILMNRKLFPQLAFMLHILEVIKMNI